MTLTILPSDKYPALTHSSNYTDFVIAAIEVWRV